MNIRRSQRVPFESTIRITWADDNGSAMARGTCEDISEHGIRISVAKAIPVGTYLALSIEGLGVRRTASVRHMGRNRVTTFTLGLELGQPVPVERDTAKS